MSYDEVPRFTPYPRHAADRAAFHRAYAVAKTAVYVASHEIGSPECDRMSPRAFKDRLWKLIWIVYTIGRRNVCDEALIRQVEDLQ